MSCYHRYYPHGCDWPPPPDWYDPYDYRPRRYRDDLVVLRDRDLEDEEDDRPRRRRTSGRSRRRAVTSEDTTEEVTAASLQSRAAALREELVRIEEDLKTLSAAPGPDAQT